MSKTECSVKTFIFVLCPPPHGFDLSMLVFFYGKATTSMLNPARDNDQSNWKSLNKKQINPTAFGSKFTVQEI